MAHTHAQTKRAATGASASLEAGNLSDVISFDIASRKPLPLHPDLLENMAGRIAGKRARFNYLGSVRHKIKKGTSRITRGGEFSIASPTTGTGLPVNAQALEEMKNAARASLVADAMAGDFLGISAIKNASRAAARELHRSTRERVFSTLEKAERGADKAREAFLADCAEDWREQIAERTITGAEDEGAEDERVDVSSAEDEREEKRLRASVARTLNAQRRAAWIYWRASGSRKWRAGLRSDLRLLRTLAADYAAGLIQPLPRGSRKQIDIFELRARLASVPAPAPAPAPVAAPVSISARTLRKREARAVITLPTHTRERFAAINARLSPYVARIIGE